MSPTAGARNLYQVLPASMCWRPEEVNDRFHTPSGFRMLAKLPCTPYAISEVCSGFKGYLLCSQKTGKPGEERRGLCFCRLRIHGS